MQQIQGNLNYPILKSTFLTIIFFMNKIIQPLERTLSNIRIPIFKSDKMITSTKPYYFLFFTALLGLVGNMDTSFFFIFVIYGIIPILDEILPLDEKNPSQEETKYLLSRDSKFKLCLYLTMVVDWALFFRGMNRMASADISLWMIPRILSNTFMLSNLNSVQFAVAHEIFHKKGQVHKYIGTVHMIKNLYMHFTYEHLYGHHKRVATPEDPATALKGTNVYQFFVQSYFGSFRSVYNMEKQEKKMFFQNYAVLSVVASVLFTILVFKVYGIQSGIFFLAVSFGSIMYLEAVNYIEHYGLLRKKTGNDQYERVTIKHSWNAAHRFSNYLLFKLQRHSDHHENSYKPYQILVTLKESPQLPHGYTVMVLMSFFPKKFFQIMDPLVDAYNSEDQAILEEQTKKSVKQTREFIVELFVYSLGMLILCNVLNL